MTDNFFKATQTAEGNLSQYGFLNVLEEKTMIPKLYVVTGMTFSILALTYFMFGPAILCNLVGFIYPVYASFRAIESPQTDDDTQWLTYWVVFASFSILEAFVHLILDWIPFYYSAKVGLLLWMYLPQTRGAIILYNHFLRPVFLEASSQLERKIEGKSKAQTSRDITGTS